MTGYDIRKKARHTMENNFLTSILCGAIATELSGLLTGVAIRFSYNYSTNF